MNHCLFATASVYYHILLPLSTKFFKKLQAMRKSAVFPSDGKLAYQMMKMLPISYGASKSSASAELAKKLRFFREFPRTVFELRMAQLRMAYLSDRGACSPGWLFPFSSGPERIKCFGNSIVLISIIVEIVFHIYHHFVILISVFNDRNQRRQPDKIRLF